MWTLVLTWQLHEIAVRLLSFDNKNYMKPLHILHLYFYILLHPAFILLYTLLMYLTWFCSKCNDPFSPERGLGCFIRLSCFIHLCRHVGLNFEIWILNSPEETMLGLGNNVKKIMIGWPILNDNNFRLDFLYK